MVDASYPASRAVAPIIVSYFENHLAAVRANRKSKVASEIDTNAVEALISAAFWASLRREENYPPTISLAYLPPEQTECPLLLETRLPLEAASLARLAPAVERPGIHLGVWRFNGELAVWGATRTLPLVCFVVEVIAPGLLVIKQSVGEDSGKFINVAVLEGDQIKELTNEVAGLSDTPPIVRVLMGEESQTAGADALHVLIQLAASMRKHGRGGSLLVVPPHADRWRESVFSPLPYSVSPLYSELRDLIWQDHESRHQRAVQEAIRRVIDMVAGLTAVDGATVLTQNCELLAFGVKIGRRDGHVRVEQVLESEPVSGGSVNIVHPTLLGGTRHLSAAQFVQDQQDAIALVASQDGRFTVFAWSPSREMVHAYRVQALLL